MEAGATPIRKYGARTNDWAKRISEVKILDTQRTIMPLAGGLLLGTVIVCAAWRVLRTVRRSQSTLAVSEYREAATHEIPEEPVPHSDDLLIE